ncbi:MAG: sulfatase-like hydrolase/transferase [Oligoflexales bacterium]
MGKRSIPFNIKRALKLSSLFLIITVSFSLGIAFTNSGSNFGQLAVSFLAKYPYIACLQALSLSLFIFVAIFLAVGSFEWLCFGRVEPNRRQGLFCTITYIFLYGILGLGTIYRYPALFENYFPTWFNQFIFNTSFKINLEYQGLAYALIITLLALLIKKKRLIIVSLSIVFLSYYPQLKWSHEYSIPKQVTTSKQVDPNILVIAVDSLRYDRIADPLLTPYINQLKDDPQSVIFQDHFIGIPRTFPSWVEILHGNYAGSTNIRHMFPNLSDSGSLQDDMAESAHKSGYRTGVFSDFAGDIFPRFKTGFESIQTPNMTIKDIIGMGIAQSTFLWLPILLAPAINSYFPYLKENPSFADPSELTSNALNWIDKEPGSKYFGAIFYSTAHFPYAAPWPWYKKYAKPEYPGPYYFSKTPRMDESENSLNQNDILQVRALYNGAIAAVDYSIGKLIEKLKVDSSYDNSLIILTADHGEDLYENGNIQGHGEHLRGNYVLNVPLIIKLPKYLKRKNRSIDFVTRAIDIAPTIKSLAARAHNPNVYNADQSKKEFRGIDLSPWIVENSSIPNLSAPELSAYSETGIWFSRAGNVHFQQQRIDYPNINELLEIDALVSGQITLKQQYEDIIITAKHRSLIWNDLKLIYIPTSTGIQYQLFFRKSDPFNLSDLSEQYPHLTASMKRKLFKVIAKIEPPKRIIQGFVLP